MKAVVVGAGIAGLAAGVRLRQIGWDVLIVERAPALRDGGYAVNFSGLGYDAAERMGILNALADKHIVYDEIVYLDDNGRDIRMAKRAQEAMLGPRSLNLMRRDIEHVLWDAYDGEIRYGLTVTAIEQDDTGVRAELSDGTTEKADLLVGADGLHSTVRAMALAPESEVRLDLDHVIGIYDLASVPADVLPRTSVSYNVPGRQVAIANLADGRAVAFFAWHTTDVESVLRGDARDVLRSTFGDLGWHVPALLDQLPDRAGDVYFDSVSQIRQPAWSRGRVVLLGDAAWCVTLFAGYGSSLAIGGAESLGTHLARGGAVESALAAWEAELRPHVEKKQKAGRRAKDLFVPSDPFRLWVRQFSLKTAASPLVTRVLERRHRRHAA